MTRVAAPTTPPWRIWLQLRKTIIVHPRQFRAELSSLLAPGCTPWYADARPLRIIQHWAPDPFTPVTLCGKWAGERSTGEIRTIIGWHCRTCHRRAKKIMRAHRRAALATTTEVSR